MTRSARVTAVLFVVFALSPVAYGLFGPRGGEGSRGAAMSTSAQQCQSCHPAVFAEWSASFHAQAFVDPEVRQLSNEYANEQCIDCHAPRPVLITGIDKPPLPRAARRIEGVDCIACHGLETGVAAKSKDAAGACAPRQDLRLTDMQLCGTCHNQHFTVDEWRATPFPSQGITCITCHMTPVKREGERVGSGHKSPASHDLDELKKALSIDVKRDGTTLRVTVKNVGAGHHFPTDERSRAADLLARVLKPDGTLDKLVRLDRYRNPYRDQFGASAGLPYREESPLLEKRLESTLLPYGVERKYSLDSIGAGSKVEVILTYKRIPFPTDPAEILADEASFRDGKAYVLFRETVAF
jgi:hypothetical protein